MGAMLQFDDAAHRYTVDGVAVPGVTSVLSWLSGYDKVPGGYLEPAAFRGTWVHRATELVDEDDLDWSTVPAEFKPYIDAWSLFKQRTGFVPDLSEERVFSKRHWYAGMLDRAGSFEILDARPCVLDIKTTAVLHPVVALQTAAYQAALPPAIAKRYKGPRCTVQLRKDGTFRLEWHKSPNDLARFLAALTLYQWSNQQ